MHQLTRARGHHELALLLALPLSHLSSSHVLFGCMYTHFSSTSLFSADGWGDAAKLWGHWASSAGEGVQKLFSPVIAEKSLAGLREPWFYVCSVLNPALWPGDRCGGWSDLGHAPIRTLGWWWSF